VKENRGSGGVDGQSLTAFEAQLGLQLARLGKELKKIPIDLSRFYNTLSEEGQTWEYRMLGVPTIYDRVCQQALLNR